MTQEKNRFARFLAGKGFYIALALLIAGAGATTWIAIDQTLSDTRNSSLAEAESSPFEDAANSAREVPLESSRDSSVSQESQAPQESSSRQESRPESSSGSSAQLKVSYIFPLSGDVINPYSGGELVKSMTLGDWRTHDGIDIQAEPTAQVSAVAQGVVREVSEDPMFGTTVRIEHPNGVISVYQSLGEKVSVEVGQSVAQGETIGVVGETALAEISLPSHLHFAMTRDGAFIDPLDEMDMYSE